MQHKMWPLLFVFVLFASSLVTGCGPGQLLGPTFTPTSTNTVTPSLTPSITPTLTPSPTWTPSPTLTPSSTPTPTIEPLPQFSDYLQNARFTFYDSFDYLDLENWQTQACQTVSNGELEYVCTNRNMLRKATFYEGEGIVVDFKTIEQTGNYYWGINFSSGEYGKAEWRDFGISTSSNAGQTTHIVKGDAWDGFNISWIKPNNWYRLILAVDKDGRILILAWERDNPEAQLWKYRNTLGADWSNLEWSFWINNDQTVTLYFDNFYQIEFDEIY